MAFEPSSTARPVLLPILVPFLSVYLPSSINKNLLALVINSKSALKSFFNPFRKADCDAMVMASKIFSFPLSRNLAFICFLLLSDNLRHLIRLQLLAV